jgi:hypothetical protein
MIRIRMPAIRSEWDLGFGVIAAARDCSPPEAKLNSIPTFVFSQLLSIKIMFSCEDRSQNSFAPL